MALKISLLASLLAIAEARFGQEQIPVDAVRQLGDDGFGAPGVAATIAGSVPGSLLAAASPCDKLTIADQMLTELGTAQPVIDAAKGLVSAETNFNPFAVNVPFVCADKTLPKSTQLRGITPLVDPAVTGAQNANALSKQSVTTPFDAQGLSQAEVMIQQGFSNFTAVNGAGENVVLAGQDGAAAGGGANNGNTNNDNVNNGNTNNGGTTDDTTGGGCTPKKGKGKKGKGNANQGNQTGNNNTTSPGTGAGNGNGAGTSNLDFGLCQPTMARVGGLNGRPATEFTFIPQDPLCAEGQQEALNPNIITNRICDQLVNVCEAADDAVAACEDAQTQIEALGTRDQSTADMWNSILGFAGVDSTVATL